MLHIVKTTDKFKYKLYEAQLHKKKFDSVSPNSTKALEFYVLYYMLVIRYRKLFMAELLQSLSTNLQILIIVQYHLRNIYCFITVVQTNKKNFKTINSLVYLLIRNIL